MSTPYASEAFLLQILNKALSAGSSSVHLKAGKPPGARVRGDMVYFRVDKSRPEDTEAVARIVTSPRIAGKLGASPAGRDPLDGATERTVIYQAAGIGRFRVTLYRQRGSLALVLRYIPEKVSAIAELGLPPIVASLAERRRGLVLVTGGVGQGKTTTLAAMVGHLNASFPCHIVTLEDPIEFFHEDVTASISQREIGADAPSFAAGIGAALRQDPDVIVVSSLETKETIEAALEAVEAGLLVLSAMPVESVAPALERLSSRVDRSRLLAALEGVVAQRLFPTRDGKSLVPAVEILTMTPAIREALAKSSPPLSPLLKRLIEQNSEEHGMQTLEAHLAELQASGTVSRSMLPPPP